MVMNTLRTYVNWYEECETQSRISRLSRFRLKEKYRASPSKTEVDSTQSSNAKSYKLSLSS